MTSSRLEEAKVQFFQKKMLDGTTARVFQVDTTRPVGDQVYEIGDGEWVVVPEFPTLEAFLSEDTIAKREGRSSRGPYGVVLDMTAMAAAAAYPSCSLALPPVVPRKVEP